MNASRLCMGVLGAIMLAACGGGGGGSAPPSQDLTGYWLLYLTPNGAPNETGPSAVYLSQTGATISGAGTTGSMSGDSFTMVSSGGSFVAQFNGTASATSASGSATFTGGLSGTGTFRLERFAPTGTVTVTGTIDTETVDITSTTAIGSRDYTDLLLSNLDEVEICAADATQQIEIDFSPPFSLAVGALSVPTTVDAVVLFRRGTSVIETNTSSGTLTVTQYDSDGFAGSFSLTLAAGGTITGTFDVAFDIASYDP